MYNEIIWCSVATNYVHFVAASGNMRVTQISYHLLTFILPGYQKPNQSNYDPRMPTLEFTKFIKQINFLINFWLHMQFHRLFESAIK